MKKAIRGSVIICLPVFLLYGCIWFESVNQPISALPGEIVTVSIVTVTTGGVYGYQPYFGVCLPDGWTIPGDSIPCTGVYTETIYYDSLVSAMQEDASPAPEGYFWWGGSGEAVETDSGSVYGIVEIQPYDQFGLFSIDYMLGNSYYMGGVNMERSDNHSIGIADEYTPRSLQASVQETSIILSWEAPVITAGLLGYNLYSDQQMLNTSLLVDTTFTDENPHDGIQYYAVSSFYDDSTEHLTPYELPVIFGDLYVSPDGNNANNGSSFANALQTITYALSIIEPDSLHPQTILLAPGTYSPYTNGEQFPISLTSYVSLIGSGEDVTILDAAFQGGALQLAQSSSAEGLTVTNGSGGIDCGGASSPRLTNITVTGNAGTGIYCSSTTGLSLVNLTITDNYAESGAGIYCTNSSMTLENVTISGNTATQSGGGIYCSTSDMTLSDVTITGNSAESGGGIYGNQSNIVFDNIRLCNIYLNYADIGNDLCSWGANMYVIVDTFTVLNPTEFQAYPIEDYVFYIMQGMVTQTAADLYVSPDGDNNNSGLTPEDPLKTIHYAFNKTVTSPMPQTVHLLNGIYSPSTNGDYFPVCMPSYVNLSGESEVGAILDAEGVNRVMRMHYNVGTTISNLTLTGGTAGQNYPNGGGIYCFISSPSLTNITITGNSAENGGGMYCDTHDPVVTNCIFWNNDPNEIVAAGGSIPEVTYCDILGGWPGEGNINQYPSFIDTTWEDYRLQWGSPCIDTGSPDPQYNDPDGTRSDMGAFFYDQSMPQRILLTPYNAPIEIPAAGGSFDYYLQVTNIDPLSLNVDAWCDVTLPNGNIYGPTLGPVNVDVGGEETIGRERTQTVPAGAPGGMYFYNAYAAAGTDTSTDSFTFFKLGASGSDGGDGWLNTGETFGDLTSELVGEPIPDVYSLGQNYPNPFNPVTTIRFGLPVGSWVKLEVFDISGRKVPSSGSGTTPTTGLVDGWRAAGYHEVTFDASRLASGIYFYRIQAGSFTDVKKMVLIK